MLKWFISPDGERFLVKDCLEKGLLSEYYTLPYLLMCSDERPWTGKPSVTQLINGTRLEYLKILTDYAEDPSDKAFAILGTKGHSKLEEYAENSLLVEIKLDDDKMTGITDLLEKQPNGEWWLTDNKTSGSYKIMKALGLVKKKRPAFYPDGNPVRYKRNGKGYKAGDPKMEDFYEVDKSCIDMFDWELQLNKYRKMIEEKMNIIMSRLKIFATIRDGNTHVARSRGVMENVYYFDVKFLDNEFIDDYFEKKRKALLDSLDFGYPEDMIVPMDDVIKNCPPRCNNQENWDGLRCKKYCPVQEACSKIDLPYPGEL